MEGNKRKTECKKLVGAGLRTCPQNGITLIALIITIIVMLILVGVTINVALNGGLFTQAQTAASDTQKEAEKEQLLSVAVAAVGTDGKVDSTKVVLPSEFEKDEEKTTNLKLVVKAKKSQTTWQIDLNTTEIKEYEEESASETYTFTIGKLQERGILEKLANGECSKDEFFTEGTSESLKNSIIKNKTPSGNELETYNISCSDSNYFTFYYGSNAAYCYTIVVMGDNIWFAVFNENNEIINSTNYLPYKDLEFTIST